MALKTISSCRACGSSKIEKFLDLGDQPLANAFLKNIQDQFGEKKYPLELAFCHTCSLVQLTYTANPKELFSNYVWVTGTSSTTKKYASRFCKEVLDFTGPLQSNDLVLEVASNDGTFLKEFMQKGCRVLGVDPAENIVAMANREGVPTECVFFGKEVAQTIVSKQGQAQIVYARNVLPHVADLHDFLAGVEIALASDGLLVLEVHYAKDILDGLQYDSIYHEHLCYFSVKSLKNLLSQFDFQIAKIFASPISGGSIVVFAEKLPGRISSSVAVYEKGEEAGRVNDLTGWKDFAARTEIHREMLLSLLEEEAKKKKKIVGYGASARSSTLLNFCGIDSHYLSVIADQNRLKRKHYTPGTHIKILPPDEIFGKSPDTILILAWNFFDEIQTGLREKYRFSGAWIKPFPKEPIYGTSKAR